MVGPDGLPTAVWITLSSSDFRKDAPLQPGETASDHAARNGYIASRFTSNLGHEGYGHGVLGLKDRKTANDSGLMSYGGTSQSINACTDRDASAALGLPY